MVIFWWFSGDFLVIFEVKSPTLIIHGKLDEVIPVEHGEVRLPGGSSTVLSNCYDDI